ncbi:hypothetical protein CYLTODRAFT_458105 [Cylindrobasidium torrendii FP15055 ss-10]|uniref:Uncharacterized protein n=1 Tax=Cylindrobasidium torrendii FP15055 ss-10 TaxID=1314674 RepID=A0A0D7AZX5_9AGAR|nr:hypothetical protein CYLTODRAFT_458105 [Cylindrobasidium torrendii FP15055 ss-10]
MCTAVPERGQFRAPEDGEDNQEFGVDWKSTRALQLKVQQLLNAKVWADASAQAVKGALEAKSECTRLKQELVVQQCRGKMFESNADVLKSEVASLEAKIRTLSIQLRDAHRKDSTQNVASLQAALDAQKRQNEDRAKAFQLKEAELKKKISQAENAIREIMDKKKKADEEIDRLKAEIESGNAAALTKDFPQGAPALAQRTTGPAVMKQASQSTPTSAQTQLSTTAQRVNTTPTDTQQPPKAPTNGSNITPSQPAAAQTPLPSLSTEFSVAGKQAPHTEPSSLTTKPTTSLPFSFATPPPNASSQTPPVSFALPSAFATPKKALNSSTMTPPRRVTFAQAPQTPQNTDGSASAFGGLSIFGAANAQQAQDRHTADVPSPAPASPTGTPSKVAPETPIRQMGPTFSKNNVAVPSRPPQAASVQVSGEGLVDKPTTNSNHVPAVKQQASEPSKLPSPSVAPPTSAPGSSASQPAAGQGEKKPSMLAGPICAFGEGPDIFGKRK